jgi:hypothetical protein
MCVALDWVREMDVAGKHELELPWEHRGTVPRGGSQVRRAVVSGA